MARGRIRESGVVIGVGAPRGEAHALVEASRPERLEGQVVGADGGPYAPVVPRSRPVFPPRRGEHPLGTLKDAAHARATPSAHADAATLLRLRPPGTRALQATYCDRAFNLRAGLHPFPKGLTTFSPSPSFLHYPGLDRPGRFKVDPSSFPLLCPFDLLALPFTPLLARLGHSLDPRCRWHFNRVQEGCSQFHRNIGQSSSTLSNRRQTSLSPGQQGRCRVFHFAPKSKTSWNKRKEGKRGERERMHSHRLTIRKRDWLPRRTFNSSFPRPNPPFPRANLVFSARAAQTLTKSNEAASDGCPFRNRLEPNSPIDRSPPNVEPREQIESRVIRYLPDAVAIEPRMIYRRARIPV